MMYTNPILFRLDDGTEVHVRQIANSKFDFELMFTNGNRKTFVWNESMPLTFTNKKGEMDIQVIEAINNLKSYHSSAQW